jgi:signal peptidase I
MPGSRAAILALLITALAGAMMLASSLFIPLAPLNIVLAVLAILVVYLGIPLHAALTARKRGTDYRLRPYNRWYLYLGVYALSAFALQPAVYKFLKTRIVEAFRVPSAAMEPTIPVGDFLYAAKWPAAVRAASRGAIVVHESVEEPDLKVIKRVVGLPGDTLQMEAGALYRNGQRLDEPYVVHSDPQRSEDPVQRAKMRSWQAPYFAARGSDGYMPDLQDWGPIVVPVDSFFALGDNRDASYDSRYYGFVPFSRILGRPWVVYFSYDPDGQGPFLRRIRWARLGQVLH